MTVHAMTTSHPHPVEVDPVLLSAAVRATSVCAQSCTACADACLAEDMVAELRRCIRTDLDCADICAAATRILSRQSEWNAEIVRAVLEACIRVCETCADECAEHAEMHEHCKVCAEACRHCADACRELLATL